MKKKRSRWWRRQKRQTPDAIELMEPPIGSMDIAGIADLDPGLGLGNITQSRDEQLHPLFAQGVSDPLKPTSTSDVDTSSEEVLRMSGLSESTPVLGKTPKDSFEHSWGSTGDKNAENYDKVKKSGNVVVSTNASAPTDVEDSAATESDEPPVITPIRAYYLTRHQDTLRSVSAQFLNSPARWGELRTFNTMHAEVAAAGPDVLLPVGIALALPGNPLVWGNPDPVHLWTLAEQFLFTAWGREPTPEEVVPFWRGLANGIASEKPHATDHLPGLESAANLSALMP